MRNDTYSGFESGEKNIGNNSDYAGFIAAQEQDSPKPTKPDKQDTEPKAKGSSNVPWIVGGCLAGLISLEVFAFVIIKLLKKP
ncbi:MAG: hypothetical protein IJ906_07170 [Oscillospiraceae bacterium]|nr:hypothetical protein [Oscillospiraceae bacterium]